MKSAASNIIKFLRENPQWFPSGELQRMRFQNKDGTLASPKSIPRRLQENSEGAEALLEVEYGTKNAAKYRVKEKHIKPIYKYIPLPSGSIQEIRVR